jgi:Xaa-Pro aminopeptidase
MSILAQPDVLAAVQDHMRRSGIDAWLCFDFRHSNHVYQRLLGGKKRHLTRRAFLLVPASGAPRLLHHGLDAPAYADVTLERERYLSWRDLHAWLSRECSGKRVAMEYVPGAALPVMSVVDAGTIDLVRAAGAEVVSSADLAQAAVARWSEQAVALHERASLQVADVKDEGFSLIRERTRAGAPVTEQEVCALIRASFERRGLEYPDGPIVGVDEHSSDPHYDPNSTVSGAPNTPIAPGQWVLIDLWARVPGDDNIFSDVTWTGFVGDGSKSRPTDRHMHVFSAVLAARDASLKRAQDGWARREPVQGWQLDDAAADVLRGAGLGEFIKHRTGHSLSPGALVHGIGMNLDNLETHDTRAMIPGIGFTIEPGAYVGPFGVRSEINVYVDAARGPRVTCPVQTEPVWCG